MKTGLNTTAMGVLLTLLVVCFVAAPVQAQDAPVSADTTARLYAQSAAARPGKVRASPGATGGSRSVRSSAAFKSCLDRAGMNVIERDRCMRQHCEGRWGKGDCPAGGELVIDTRKFSRTPLGNCLREAGNNPFKRTSCGWKYCKGNWDTPECATLKSDPPAQAN